MCTCTWTHTHTHKKNTHARRHETQPININYIWRALLRWSNRNWKPRLTYLQKNLTNSWSLLLGKYHHDHNQREKWSCQMTVLNHCVNFRKRENSWQNGIHLQQRYTRITHLGPLDLRKWVIFNTILMSPKSWLSQEDLDACCEHSMVPGDS